MAFTFPSDSNNKAGAVKSTTDGTDFYVPVREQGSESLTANVQNVTTAGTAVQLPNIPCRKVMIIAKRANTGYIYVGGSNVTSSIYGADLGARDSIVIEISNANLLYINSSVSGEGVSYFAI
jgi:hypothetical protein